MANWKILKKGDLPGVLSETQALVASADLDIGKIYLSLEYSTLESLGLLRSLLSLPNFFHCGKVTRLEILRDLIDRPSPVDLAFLSPGPNNPRVLALKDLVEDRAGFLEVTGSPSAFALAKSDSEVKIGHGESFTLLYASRDSVRRYWEAAWRDFHGDFEQREFWCEVYGSFPLIAELFGSQTISPSSELKGFLGYRPAGAPLTNVYLDTLPILVQELERMAQGKIEIAQQIVGLGGRKFDSWNVLSIKRDFRRPGQAHLDLFSLNALPKALRKAIERRGLKEPANS